MKKKLLLLGAMFVCMEMYGQKNVLINDLDLSKIWQEYGSVVKGKTITGDTAVINGVVRQDVLGLHAQALAKIKLDGNALRFTAQVGIMSGSVKVDDPLLITQPLVDGAKLLFSRQGDVKQFKALVGRDGKIGAGSAELILKLDGKEIYRSGILRPLDGMKSVDVSLSQGGMLELLLEAGPDGASGDGVLLVEPKLVYNGDQPVLVDVHALGDGPVQSQEVSRALSRKIAKLPVMNALLSDRTDFDWLLSPEKSQAGIYRTADGKGIVIANAMVSRTFRLFPNLATVDLTNRMLGESLLRAVSGEGYVWIDGKKWSLGGLSGQPERGYLKNEWLDELKTIPQ